MTSKVFMCTYVHPQLWVCLQIARVYVCEAELSRGCIIWAVARQGDVFLPGCWADLRLKGLNRKGTKASEPEGGGEWMSWWDDNAAWHLWNESPVTMAKKRDGTVSQGPRIKPAVNDVWLVFRSCSSSAETLFPLFVPLFRPHLHAPNLAL